MTLLGLPPHYGTDYTGLTHVLMSAPFDGGTVTNPGARHGPEIVRTMSPPLPLADGSLIDPRSGRALEGIRAADRGDIVPLALHPASSRKSVYQRIEDSMRDVTGTGAVPILIGGDHSITAPAVVGAARQLESLDLIVLDAHVDVGATPIDSYEQLTHATFLDLNDLRSRLRRILVGGARDYYPRDSVNSTGDALVTVVNTDAIVDRLWASDPTPVYLSIDLDVLDPSVLPDTGHPVPGGLTFRELEKVLLALLKQRRAVAVDIVEAMPGNDQNTGLVVARLLQTIIPMTGNRVHQ